ncbi:MAG: DUF2141 domain-containing protein [Alphaproteobacteria bacterium]|nr:DUF2141 domain-containing protein [Alphaproteobacteria bacterium]
MAVAFPSLATEVTINVTHDDSTADLYYIVYEDEEAFEDFDLTNARSVPATGEQTIVAIDLSPGEYAILMFIDTDGNGEMSTNFIGIPKEPLGVVGNAEGRPRWKTAKFAVGARPLVLEATVAPIF